LSESFLTLRTEKTAVVSFNLMYRSFQICKFDRSLTDFMEVIFAFCFDVKHLMIWSTIICK